MLVIALALVLVVATGCGSSSSSGSSDSTSTGSSAPADAGVKKGFKVALLTPGTGNDGSWGQAVAQGAKEYGAKYDAKVTVAENLDDPAQYLQQGTSFASSGFDLVIVANGAMGEVTQRLAKQYPKVKFAEIATGLDPLPPNATTAVPQFQNGTFVAGVLAGLMTETNKVGAIGGFSFPVLTAEMESFLVGVRYANPKASISRTYINSWTDTGKAKAAAQAQAAKGVDIIFSATDQASQGMFQLAQTGKTLKYVIPQYFDKNDQAPTVVLTSVLYNLQGVTGNFIDMFAKGEWKSENAEPALDQKVGELAPFHGLDAKVPAAAKAKVLEVQDQIRSGALKVPRLDALGKPNSADKIDIESIGPSS
jgi:basic membrane lipoprotein Med (substrate-binding protein (PBP1-ABC) superfamily)